MPPFFSLVAAIKSDPRLLLRHAADAEPPGDHVSGAAWAAGSGLASPYCILSSLAQLLGLGRSTGAASRDSSRNGGGAGSCSAGGIMPAPTVAPASLPPAVASAAPDSPALHSQPSWTIGAAAAELAAAAGKAAAAVEGTHLQPAPQVASSALITARSIGPLPASWSSPGSPGSRCSSRSSSVHASGSGGRNSGGYSSPGAVDGGHLVSPGVGSSLAPAAPAAAEPAEQGWSLWSFFS